MIDVDRLQAYLRWSAGRNRIAIDVPPFTLFVSPHDERVWFNYAVPNQPVSGDPRQAISRVRVQFARSGRRAAFEYLEAYAPDLAPSLVAAGFVLAERETVMGLEPERFQPAPPVPGLEIVLLDADSPAELIRSAIVTTERGFDPDPMRLVLPTRSDVEDFRSRLVGARAFLALLGGEPVGAGMFTAPYEGLTEVAGIATLPPFRRQGIASAITTRAVDVAYRAGIQSIFLSYVDEPAARIYARLGFRPITAKLVFHEPEL